MQSSRRRRQEGIAGDDSFVFYGDFKPKRRRAPLPDGVANGEAGSTEHADDEQWVSETIDTDAAPATSMPAAVDGVEDSKPAAVST